MTPPPTTPHGWGAWRLAADLAALGVRRGSIVLVHASLRRIRPDEDGAATVVRALLDAVGPRGTVVVPTQTAWNSTTSPHFRAATAGMTPDRVTEYLSTLPAFDPLTTPSEGMGAVAEHVRTLPRAVRSTHPQTSFAAVGPDARDLLAVHDLDCLLGERSPLAALYRSDARVLLLGTGYGVSTVFHLGEWRAATRRRRYECRNADGWVSFNDVDYDDSDFAELGDDFEKTTGVVRRGAFGSARALHFPARAAVDHAEEWMRRVRRERRLCTP